MSIFANLANALTKPESIKDLKWDHGIHITKNVAFAASDALDIVDHCGEFLGENYFGNTPSYFGISARALDLFGHVAGLIGAGYLWDNSQSDLLIEKKEKLRHVFLYKELFKIENHEYKYKSQKLEDALNFSSTVPLLVEVVALDHLQKVAKWEFWQTITEIAMIALGLIASLCLVGTALHVFSIIAALFGIVSAGFGLTKLWEAAKDLSEANLTTIFPEVQDLNRADAKISLPEQCMRTITSQYNTLINADFDPETTAAVIRKLSHVPIRDRFMLATMVDAANTLGIADAKAAVVEVIKKELRDEMKASKRGLKKLFPEDTAERVALFQDIDALTSITALETAIDAYRDADQASKIMKLTTAQALINERRDGISRIGAVQTANLPDSRANLAVVIRAASACQRQGQQEAPPVQQGAPQGEQGAAQGEQGAAQGEQGAAQGGQGAAQGGQGAAQGGQGAAQGEQGAPQGGQGAAQGEQGAP